MQCAAKPVPVFGTGSVLYIWLGYEGIVRALFHRAQIVGMAQSAFEHSVSFAGSRGTYGRTIFSHQGVSFPIAEMYSNISIARNMLYHVAAITEAGEKATLETAALKLFSSEMCRKVCADAVLIHGGRGFRSHCDIERMLRDSQLLTVAEGTSQICKVIISNGIYNAGEDMRDLM